MNFVTIYLSLLIRCIFSLERKIIFYKVNAVRSFYGENLR